VMRACSKIARNSAVYASALPRSGRAADTRPLRRDMRRGAARREQRQRAAAAIQRASRPRGYAVIRAKPTAVRTSLDAIYEKAKRRTG